MASFFLLWPLALAFRSRFRRGTGLDALDARVRQIWQTSPDDAVALLRSTFEQLLARDAFLKLRPVELEPFGKFAGGDLLSIQRFLYDSEVALGHLEQALAVAAALPGRLDVFVLQQVDCLVALGRREEAIALLERNLDIDGWRGTLRRRLTELGGRHLRALN
jgi:tetratricopeptide (TPR) repeat protein